MNHRPFCKTTQDELTSVAQEGPHNNKARAAPQCPNKNPELRKRSPPKAHMIGARPLGPHKNREEPY